MSRARCRCPKRPKTSSTTTPQRWQESPDERQIQHFSRTRDSYHPLTVGVTTGMVLLLVAAFAPVPAVWVLVLYGAGMAAAAAGVLVQRRRVRR